MNEARINDSVFGFLRQTKNLWSGETAWPYQTASVLLSIHGAPHEPNAEDHQVFCFVRDGYQELLPTIAKALFTLWGNPDPSWEGPTPSSPEELMALLELNSVFVQSRGKVELLYAFAGDIWPDAMLTVAIQDGKVEPVAFDD